MKATTPPITAPTAVSPMQTLVMVHQIAEVCAPFNRRELTPLCNSSILSWCCFIAELIAVRAVTHCCSIATNFCISLKIECVLSLILCVSFSSPSDLASKVASLSAIRVMGFRSGNCWPISFLSSTVSLPSSGIFHPHRKQVVPPRLFADILRRDTQARLKRIATQNSRPVPHVVKAK